MKLPFETEIKNIEETKFIAKEINKILAKGDVIVLNGNLGSGKTTLIKYIASEFGIDNVNSPSFAIVNEYVGVVKIYHFDFYRIKKIEELYDIGIDEYLNDPEAIIFIEWGNLMSEIIPKSHIEIQLHLQTQNTRNIKILKKN